jgi:hypothetical protein
MEKAEINIAISNLLPGADQDKNSARGVPCAAEEALILSAFNSDAIN